MSTSGQHPSKVFKILNKSQWETWSEGTPFTGAGDDLKDGFIHLSTASQVVETYEKFFKETPDLVLITVDLEKVGDEVKWEPSRHGQLFPHVYGVIDKSAVIDTVEDWSGEQPEV